MKYGHLSSLSMVACCCALLAASEGRADSREGRRTHRRVPVVDDYKITILSDSIPGRYTIGEWGFSAVVEVTSHHVTKRFLFDASDKPETVLFNADKLGIDVCDVEDVVLSHHHADHTGGLDNLRRTCAAINPKGISRVHVGAPEFFWPRVDGDGNQKNPMVKERPQFEAAGGTFVIDDQPREFLLPGVFLTGRIARAHDEKTYLPTTPLRIQDPSGRLGEERVPEDQALVIDTAEGVVILTGCGHAGAVNTIEQAVRMVGGGRPNVILAGGLHWFQMDVGDWRSEGTLDWEANSLASLNVGAMLGSHCTGLERFFYVRERLGLDPTRAAISSVGTVLARSPRFTFTLPQAFNTPVATPRTR